MGIRSHLRRARLLALLPLICLALGPVEAGSATWNLNPVSGDWNRYRNWTPNTVPNSGQAVATFDGESHRYLYFGAMIQLIRSNLRRTQRIHDYDRTRRLIRSSHLVDPASSMSPV